VTFAIDLIDEDPVSPIAAAPSPYRPYQVQAKQSVWDGWLEEGIRAQLIVMATGTGKTVVMGGLAQAEIAAGGRVLMIAHTDELIDQGIEKFSSISGLRAGKEKAQDHATLWDKVVCGSVQTLRGAARLQGWPKNHFSLVLVDEAHRTLAKSYTDVLGHFMEGGAKIVGVTATADRGDKQALGQFYQRIAFEYGMLRACKDGWLVRPLVQTIKVGNGIDLNGVAVKRNTEGDTDLDRMEVAHRIEPLLKDLAKEIYRHAPLRRVLLFLPSVDTAKKMASALREAGYPTADWVAGDDAERTRKVADYKANKIQVLCNAMLLTEGFDHDAIDCLVVLRPTKVRALYVQMVGRGTRPLSAIVPALNRAPDAVTRNQIIRESAKPHVLILDPMWLYEQHDLAAPASLVTKNAEEAKRMEGKQGDLLDLQAQAERDAMEWLRKELLKNVNRKAALIDPFAFGAVIKDDDLASYQPETLWEAREPTLEQLQALAENGIEPAMVKWRGQAQRVLKVIQQRRERGLCSVRLMNWLGRHKIDATLMTQDEAQREQRRLFATGFKR
jgi:superfamily II DNA or RNA helicase